jgi:hypothetical protein
MKSSSRNGETVIWVAIHTAQGARKAEDLRAYFERPEINASSHAIVDDNVLLDNLVPYDRAAWTLRDGNAISDNLEICAFAEWSREEWLRHPRMLALTAQWIRQRCLARGIPIAKIGPAGVRLRVAGVIGHIDYTEGTNDGTHWDPGPNFPWDVVLSQAIPPVKRRKNMILVRAAGKPIAIYSGGILTGLVDDEEVRNLEAVLGTARWINTATWNELDRKSRRIVGDSTT